MNKLKITRQTSGFISIADKLLCWSLPTELQAPICGDCHEHFAQLKQQSNTKAYAWLGIQICSVLWHYSRSTQRGTFMFLISLIAIIAVILMTFLLGGELSMFFDVPSILIVCLPAIMVSLMAVGKVRFIMAFKLLFNAHLLAEQSDTKQYLKAFDVMGKTAMLMGWFGVITGAIAIASNIEADAFSRVFGPAFAVMCLTLLYAWMIKTLCYVASTRLDAQV